MATIRPIEARDHDEWVALFTQYGVFYETTFTTPQIEAVWSWLMDPTHPHNAWVAETDGSQFRAPEALYQTIVTPARR